MLKVPLLVVRLLEVESPRMVIVPPLMVAVFKTELPSIVPVPPLIVRLLTPVVPLALKVPPLTVALFKLESFLTSIVPFDIVMPLSVELLKVLTVTLLLLSVPDMLVVPESTWKILFEGVLMELMLLM